MMLSKEKVLITGASGFIGTNLLAQIANNGYEVINIDFKEPKNAKHLKYWKNIDITNFDKFKNCVVDFAPNYIVHLAARTDLEGKSSNDYNANISGVKNLIQIVKNLSSLKKIIITSSMLVCHSKYKPKDQFDFAPTTIYGESKVETEKIVWANQPICDWTIIRPTSIWGPWFDAPYKNFFDMVINRKYFHIGSRGCTKTYGYIGNAVYQIEQILFSETIDNTKKVFYIGDYQPTNIEKWANEIAAELGISIIKIPFLFMKIVAIGGDILKSLGMNFPMSTFRLKNMTTDNVVDLSNIKEIAPELPFSRTEGIKATLNWITQSKLS